MVNHFIDNLFPHLSPTRRAAAVAAWQTSPLGGKIVCRVCKKRFISYQQLTNHKRKEGGCKPVRSQTSAESASAAATHIPTTTPSSPLRQFNAFQAFSASFSPTAHSPSPPRLNPDPAAPGTCASPEEAEVDTSYHHLISPEPRTSAIGEQVGARFDQAAGRSEPSDAASEEDPVEEKKKEVVAFIKYANGGRGLSRKDQNWLLSFLNIPGLRNAKDVQRYIDNLPKPEGWSRVNLAGPNDGQDLFLDYCDAYTAVLNLWKDPAHAGKLILKPKILRGKHGERRYREAHTGVWWNDMQKLIPASDTVLALILYSDGTPLSLSGRLKVRPVILSLANIPKELRGKVSGWVLVGYIPYVDPRADLGLSENSEGLRLRQLQIWHESYRLILERLKLYTWSGMEVEDAAGVKTSVWPMIYGVVTDWQEGCVAAGTKSGNMTNCPCHTCLVLASDLNDLAAGRRAELRTEKKMKQIYDQVVELHRKGGCNVVIEQLLKGYSVNPVENALWGWKGGDTKSGNVYRSILPEIMHQLDHGVIPMLFELVGAYARDKFGAKEGNKRLALANKRFLSFRNTHPGLRLPNINFLGGSSFVTAFEHRHSLSVAVYAVVGVFTLPNGRDEITPLLRDFADVYLDFAVRHKSKGHSDASLAKVDSDWDKVLARMKKILPYQASGWGTVKIHTNAHSTDSVSLRGLSDEYSADNYESSHKTTAKNPFRASNKNHMQLQMVKHVTDRLALRQAGKDYFVPTRREVALRMRAKAQKTNLLSVKGRPLRLFRLSTQSLRDGNRDPLLLSQPELVHLERVLRAHLGGNPRGARALLENLPSVQDAKIVQHKTLAIARARQPDGSLKTELARANPCFGQNKRPMFSDVVVNGVGSERQGRVERVEWLAQLRLLFSCVDQRGRKRAYAFVKWYKKTGPQDATKSVRLKWEVVKGPDGVEQVRYDVIGLQSISRLAHVLPDLNNEGLFYVNETRLV